VLISATVSAGISKKLIGKIGGKVISRQIPPKIIDELFAAFKGKIVQSPQKQTNKLS